METVLQHQASFGQGSSTCKKYYDCMKVIADWKPSGPLNGPETKKLVASEFNCRKDLALNLPEDFKFYHLKLLPEMHNVQI